MKYVFLQIFDFQNCTINNLTSLNNQITVLSINQQPDTVSNFIMNFSKLSSQEINEPLIELNFVDTILFNEVLMNNNVLKQNSQTSIVYVSQCNRITINNSQFQNNTNFNGLGGSLYVFNCLHILIQDSIFIKNKCLRLNGGAISIQNVVNIAQVYIYKCQFIFNSAIFSTGGAINLSYANLIIENSNVTSNTAIIGGGIYYEQVIPDFVLEKSNNNIDNNKNKILNNNAKIFGDNIGSTIRKIDIDLQNIKIPRDSVKIMGERQIEIREFKSGNQITFEGIQLLDEENNPIKISNINITEFQFYSSDIQNFVYSLSVSLNWDQSNKKIQVIGQVQSRQVINNGINLQSQIMYMPQSRMSLQIVLDTLPKLIDSKGNIFFLQNQFQKNFTIDFTSCSIGEITTQQIESIICQECPEGKYSLDQYSTDCKQCPDSAKKCYGSTINLMNGYWRENNTTDIIVYCNQNPEFCQAESSDSKFICLRGHIGPLCQQCDSYGVIWGNRYSQILSSDICYDCNESVLLIAFENSLTFLLVFLYIFIILIKIIQKMQVKVIGYFVNKSEILFLGSTLRQSDKSQIVAKILTDHFQILSLLSSFQINIPTFFKFPVLLYGNSLSITSKSFDCIISKYLILQPLWFYQTLFSLALPLLVLTFYILFGLIFKLIKKDNFLLNYLRTALIFTYLYYFPMVVTLLSRSINCIQIGDKQYLDLDYNIHCMDSKYHKPYIIYFSLPLLIIWTLAIPLFLFRKVRNGKKQKWSIFKEIKYSFVFAGFKDKFYYWEFGKLFYKSLLISISILLQQNEQLKTSLLNGIILLWICIVFKLKPYIVKDFNNLLQQSAILSQVSLNIIFILGNKLTNQLLQRTFLTLILFFINLLFILQFAKGQFQTSIPFDQSKRNIIHNILYYLKVKYPRLLKNIQIENRLKFQSLIKLKNVKKKIKMLVQYFKNYDFYNQESFQQHFGLLKASIDNTTQLQISKFTYQNFNQVISKNSQSNQNSIITLQKKLSFYTRKMKQSPLSKLNQVYQNSNQFFKIQQQVKYKLQNVMNDKSQEYSLNASQFEKFETMNIKDEIDSINL
ncbi:transmembrane protein, putative (macronuclear) [Tetrahymena thermophila SB210]|uniref:Transmembrane protein, putative n=1 Tax=Tetrahymena thermophila (strain SB210) TaxID=312017 RepID=Q22EJ1_TETTS|nr:transmembrane protein, putative [Tetrahymena thermophila SB210]EAR83661.2 transmembrane protein, putative [Tetrahymena thermophila SB210]|eukprot:XP_001031324.2 transmembrane protein, putative [Tetrahymena thermophila SB210]